MHSALPARLIDVLVVDDSPLLRRLLVHLLESDPALRVIGAVEDGHAALAFVERTRPDVILMDINMPGIDGFETTRRIMQMHPIPIVICSATSDPASVAGTFELMDAGAVACVQKPVARSDAASEALATSLLTTVKLMSEVKMVRRWARTPASPARAAAAPPVPGAPAGAVRLIGMGTSTGGPPVLQAILELLPPSFPVPILVVQHIAAGFLPGLAAWLTQTTKLQVRIAAHGEQPAPGHVYLAPDDVHMGVGAFGEIALTQGPAENATRPAVAHLFRSMARQLGSRAVGVLLTGMGGDGAEELRLMRDAGAVTVAQDRESSVVFGMPGEAVRLGAATHVLSPERIAGLLLTLTSRRG